MLCPLVKKTSTTWGVTWDVQGYLPKKKLHISFGFGQKMIQDLSPPVWWHYLLLTSASASPLSVCLTCSSHQEVCGC